LLDFETHRALSQYGVIEPIEIGSVRLEKGEVVDVFRLLK